MPFSSLSYGIFTQFSAKQLEKLAKKAEKDSKTEQAKVKKVRVFCLIFSGVTSHEQRMQNTPANLSLM